MAQLRPADSDCVDHRVLRMHVALCPTDAGFFFLFLGGIITWRVVTFSQAANRNPLLVLSGLMALAGLICIFYQRHWFFSLSAAFRVPIYTILGVSLSFALAFAIAELLNYASTSGIPASNVPQRAQSAIVQTPEQIYLLAAASVGLGFVFGIIFGFAEVGRGVFTLHTLRVRAQAAMARVSAAQGCNTAGLSMPVPFSRVTGPAAAGHVHPLQLA